MARLAQHGVGRALFHHAAGVQHADVVADARHHAEVVRDVEHRQAAVAPQLLQQVEDLRLDGHVERGGRLVQHQQLGRARERGGDERALLHAAGELVREGERHLAGVGDAHLGQQALRTSVAAAASGMPLCQTSGSAICRPTAIAGLSEVNGSWNTMLDAVAAQRAPLPRPASRTVTGP